MKQPAEGRAVFVLSSDQRRLVALRATALGMSFDQYMGWVIHRDLEAVGLAPGARGMWWEADNGDEYGQRVAQHLAMVRGMAR
jgi:hypothetical protein